LEIACCVSDAERLLVARSSLRHLAPFAVDLTEMDERIREIAGAELLGVAPSRVDVGERLLDAAEGKQGFRPVAERQRTEDRDAREFRGPDGDVQLGDGLGVFALLEVTRPPIRTNSHDLQRVPGALRVFEGATVVKLVLSAIAVERSHKRLGRVGGGAGSII
jgi:hypothetical protein